MSFDAFLTPREVNSSNYQADFRNNIGSDGAFFASLQSFRGADTAALRTRSVTPNGATIFVQEERSADNEIAHDVERVGFLSIESGFLFGTRVTNANSQSNETLALPTSDAPTSDADLSQLVGLASNSEAGLPDVANDLFSVALNESVREAPLDLENSSGNQLESASTDFEFVDILFANAADSSIESELGEFAMADEILPLEDMASIDDIASIKAQDKNQA